MAFCDLVCLHPAVVQLQGWMVCTLYTASILVAERVQGEEEEVEYKRKRGKCAFSPPGCDVFLDCRPQINRLKALEAEEFNRF